MSDLNNLKLYYFTPILGSPIRGRGENVRLLLIDAGIDFEYIRYNHDQWKDIKESLKAKNFHYPTMPYIVTEDGQHYFNTLPVLRTLSRKLGKYQGENDDDTHLLDVYTDMINDWGFRWALVTFLPHTDEDEKIYREKTLPGTFEAWDKILSDSKGPYLLGKNISYADFNLFHLVEDDDFVKVDAQTYPHLSAFVEAFKNRPNLKKFLISSRA